MSASEPTEWDDPLDPVVTTVPEVAAGGNPVLWVVHESGHGGWQFYDSFSVGERRPVVLPKTAILALDSSLEQVTDLPVGWQAEREAVGSMWKRSRLP